MAIKSDDTQMLAARYAEFMRRRLASASTSRQRAIRALILVMAEAEVKSVSPCCGLARVAAHDRAAASQPPF
jgi:hypothetical protein